MWETTPQIRLYERTPEWVYRLASLVPHCSEAILEAKALRGCVVLVDTHQEYEVVQDWWAQEIFPSQRRTSVTLQYPDSTEHHFEYVTQLEFWTVQSDIYYILFKAVLEDGTHQWFVGEPINLVINGSSSTNWRDRW